MFSKKENHLYYSQKLPRRGDFKKYRIKVIEPCGLDYHELDTTTEFLGQKIKFPNYINAMTGGTDSSRKINHRLVTIANFFKIPIMTGSMNPYIGFREFTGFEPFLKSNFVIANLSARNTLEELKRAADKIKTPYVAMHINTMQELLQLLGDLDFRDEIKNIEAAVKYFGDNLIIKAVGQGFSKESIRILKEVGVKNLDISGSGGTDFSKIELMQYKSNFPYPHIPTSESIINAKDSGMYIISSGGIDTAREMFMSLALGANITASAYFYLTLLKKSQYDIATKLYSIESDFKKYMMISSSKNIEDIKGKIEVIK